MVSVFIVLLILQFQNVIISASIGATAFIIFAMPENITAGSRRVIGGYCIGALCGSLCALIPQPFDIITLLVYAFAVGLSIFLMVVFDMEHPPASGIALGMAISGFSWKVIIATMSASIMLSIIHTVFKKYIRDLV